MQSLKFGMTGLNQVLFSHNIHSIKYIVSTIAIDLTLVDDQFVIAQSEGAFIYACVLTIKNICSPT